MYEMSETRKSVLEQNVGLTLEQMKYMDLDELDRYVEKKIGKKLKYDKPGEGPVSVRGSILLCLDKILGKPYKDKVHSPI